jgi:hypothetical protein
MKECNFKQGKINKAGPFCYITKGNCSGEDNCILYQIYKNIGINK